MEKVYRIGQNFFSSYEKAVKARKKFYVSTPYIETIELDRLLNRGVTNIIRVNYNAHVENGKVKRLGANSYFMNYPVLSDNKSILRKIGLVFVELYPNIVYLRTYIGFEDATFKLNTRYIKKYRDKIEKYMADLADKCMDEATEEKTVLWKSFDYDQFPEPSGLIPISWR